MYNLATSDCERHNNYKKVIVVSIKPDDTYVVFIAHFNFQFSLKRHQCGITECDIIFHQKDQIRGHGYEKFFNRLASWFSDVKLYGDVIISPVQRNEKELYIVFNHLKEVVCDWGELAKNESPLARVEFKEEDRLYPDGYNLTGIDPKLWPSVSSPSSSASSLVQPLVSDDEDGIDNKDDGDSYSLRLGM